MKHKPIRLGRNFIPKAIGFLLYLFQLTAPLVMAASGLSTVQAGLTNAQRLASSTQHGRFRRIRR